MADNMGGISETWFVIPKDVKNIITGSGLAKVILKDGAVWFPVHIGRYGTVIKVEPQTADAGTLYNVSATIQIPRQYLDEAGMFFCKRLNRTGAVIKYKNFNGDWFVVGSERFPLKCTFEILHPNNPGGFSGYKLTISGKQLSPQLQITE
ncbi:hypothetical protein [Parabacteroides sp. AM08-6]|uniref:hypothetical protein n=1 Tax=Parabacteroides sp. AM08-6 TaxID=2292053 RepID=UPI000EFDE853|nr:hypothetical protein [Parabacteroides sp. AM08-6]RHJ83528.1 hypothetical protein DW103_07325 [Parabacteroides sp. AM08-6]